MSIAEISIRRPVAAWMVMIGLVVFGLISFQRLGISYLPDVDFPVVTVGVTWEGAAPEVIESEIVDQLEQRVISLEGLKNITSTIRQGSASLGLEFEFGRDIDAALQETQAAISSFRLPAQVDPPTVRKTNPDDQPIVWVGVSSPKRPIRELITFVEQSVRDRFEVLPGVGEVVFGGYTDRNLRIWLSSEALRRHELTALDVRDALLRGHNESAAGIIENSENEINLRVMGEGRTAAEVAAVVIPRRGARAIFGALVTIGDVARVEDGLADVRRVSRANGVPAVGLGIKKQRGANAVEVGRNVRALVAELQRALPEDLSIDINFDSTVFVEEAVAETQFTVVLSAIITGIVCWLFLGAISPTINVLIAIPTSVIGACIGVYLFGFSLNFFTILALSLAVGIVVDDAIMVLENIYRHRAMGKGAPDAARDGATEILGAAIAASFAIVAIFVPILFMRGVIGTFLFQFGVTLSIAVLLSLLEAITLTPVRCSQMLGAAGGDLQTHGRVMSVVARLYQHSLAGALRHPWLVVIAAVLVFVLSMAPLTGLRREFLPAQDQSTFTVRVETPVGSSLEATGHATERVEGYLRNLPEVRRVFTTIGGFGGGEVNTAVLFVSLLPRERRSDSQADIMNRLRREFSSWTGLRVFLQDLSTRGFTAQRGFPVDLNVRGPSWSVLAEKAQAIVAELEREGLVVDAATDYRTGQPEVRVIPDRDAAARRGVLIDQIVDTVAVAIGGVRVNKFTSDGRRYDTRVRLAAADRLQPDQLGELSLRNMFGEVVLLREVARIESGSVVQTITRRNRERSVSVYGNVAPGRSQAEVLSRAEAIARRVLPEGYAVYFGGGSEVFRDSFSGLSMVIWLGVVVAYMILAAQFNSFVQPIAVLVSLPFCLSGAALALSVAGLSLNLFSVIGLVLLMGIVKKNAILLVDFANQQRREHGASPPEALLRAAEVRLRPIVMTSASTLAAALPAALALGPGAESRIPMAVAIIGGVLVSTLFTLYVVPAVYCLLPGRGGKSFNHEGREKHEG